MYIVFYVFQYVAIVGCYAVVLWAACGPGWLLSSWPSTRWWGPLASSEPFVLVVKFAATMWGARLHYKKKCWLLVGYALPKYELIDP